MSRACLRPPSCKDAGVALGGVDAEGRFCGYASLFGVADQGRDMVMPGAFAQTLKARGVGGIKMLYQHDPAEPIGLWREIVEDARGLRVEGQLMLELARAREVHALMRAGVLDGLSIGFRTLSGRRDAKSGLRRLYRIDLWEISLVTFPMQEQARVGTVRSAPFAQPCLAAARAMRLAASDNRQAANRAGHPAPLQRRQPLTTAANNHGR